MKFIDEVTVHIQAGKGGDGCCSFRREKFIPFGGPDGGNGGNGGDIYLQATSRLHTLVDLNYKKSYKAENGKAGSGSLCTGKSGEHLVIRVPIGTIAKEADTGEIIGDLIEDQQVVLVAKGGQGGLGNYNFKSSTNRAPRKIIKGTLGDERNLHLELKLLADVGLLGFPNAGKSSLISKVSSAKPKIADYPFTTINPHLGVVKVDDTSFVMADVPGLLEGAASGVGLGIRFLKHLSRTALLLHVVDLAAALSDPPNSDIILDNLIKQINIIEQELEKYQDPELTVKTRWIAINKVDLLSKEQLNKLSKKLLNNKKYNKNKIFWISAVSGFGINELCKEIIKHLRV
ncbi:MAG: Obg family GTPase CgtA [Gammaproteobacteria bacterium]|jgi:GTP-binding protein